MQTKIFSYLSATKVKVRIHSEFNYFNNNVCLSVDFLIILYRFLDQL